MKTKALVLACQTPYVGPWVDIEGGEWGTLIKYHGQGYDPMKICIEVHESDDGGSSLFPATVERVRGISARAIVDVMDQIEALTIYLMEVSDGSDT